MVDAAAPGPDGELKTLRYEVAEHIARITLDRPERHNAWTGRMHLEYRWAMTVAEADPDVRVILLTGAGTSFCVGADRDALAGNAARGHYDDGLRGQEPPMPPVGEAFRADFAFQLGMRTPIVAAVNGAAAGVGLAMVCFADVRFAVSGAKLTTAAPRLGLPAEYGLSWILPRLVGAGRAADWLLSGRVVTTDEAGHAGLFAGVADAGALDGEVGRYVATLAHHVAPSSVAAAKAQLWGDLLGTTPAHSVETAAHLLREMTGSDDFRTGVAALTERRTPRF